MPEQTLTSARASPSWVPGAGSAVTTTLPACYNMSNLAISAINAGSVGTSLWSARHFVLLMSDMPQGAWMLSTFTPSLPLLTQHY
jgi:hypothetical protein